MIEAGDEKPGTLVKQEPILAADVVSRIKCRSPYWRDQEMKAAILSLYGRSSANDAVAILAAEFGAERAPGKSALGRIYAMLAQQKAG